MNKIRENFMAVVIGLILAGLALGVLYKVDPSASDEPGHQGCAGQPGCAEQGAR
jgi:hypothetical protein